MPSIVPTFIERRLDPEQEYAFRLTLVAIAFLLITIPFGLLLEQVLSHGPMTEVDLSASEHLVALARDHAWANSTLEVISFLGKPIFLAAVIGLPAVLLFRRGERRIAVYLVVTAITGGIVDTVLKIVVNRPRPTFGGAPLNEAYGNSFPSGHSLSSVVCYGAVLLVVIPYVRSSHRRPVMLATAAIVLAIGLSRLGLGVHYTSDVLGGYVLGVAWLLLATAAFSIWRVERGEEPVSPTLDGIEPEHDPALIAAHERAGDETPDETPRATAETPTVSGNF